MHYAYSTDGKFQLRKEMEEKVLEEHQMHSGKETEHILTGTLTQNISIFLPF